MDAETDKFSSNFVWLSSSEPCQQLLIVMALVPSSRTFLFRQALGLPSKVSPWVLSSSGLEFWYHRLWQTRPLQGRNLEVNESLFIPQKVSRPAESQGFKTPEVLVWEITWR